MKTSTIILSQAIVGLLPVLYLLAIWNGLPLTVPTHYNAQMVADDFGTRYEILGILLFMFAIAIGTSALILNLDKFDPKQKYTGTGPLMVKVSWTLIIFLSLISVFIVYETGHYVKTGASGFSGKYLLASICLMLAAMGNLMNSMKPNYFVGIRTPWTLQDEENWRKTHRLGSKIWFFGGLCMFVMVLALPVSLANYVMTIGIIPLCVIPIGYSYSLFRQKQKQG